MPYDDIQGAQAGVARGAKRLVLPAEEPRPLTGEADRDLRVLGNGLDGVTGERGSH